MNATAFEPPTPPGQQAPPHYGNNDLHDAELKMIYCSIAILTFFLLENLLLLIANGIHFFLHVLQVFDVFVPSLFIYIYIYISPEISSFLTTFSFI